MQSCLNVATLAPLMCQVNLVRPSGQILELAGGAVTGQLLWSADGKYLIGAGNNTIRLWNLVGGRRSVTVKNFAADQIQAYRIGKMWWQGQDLCVQATGPTAKSFTARFTVPHLQPVKTVARLAC